MPAINSKFNHKVLDLMIASFKVHDDLWDEARIGRKWLSLANYDLLTTVQVIKEALLDQNVTKHIICQAFQKFAGEVDPQIIIGHMRDIKEIAVKQSTNRIAFSTCWFPPALEKNWGAIGIINREAHRLNEAMQIPRVNLHRAVMSQKSQFDLSMRTRPAMWAEYQLGIGLGRTLSHEGQQHVVRCISKVFDTVFATNAITRKSRETRIIIPPSLRETSGYYDNDFMVQQMEDKRIIQPRPVSTGGGRQQRLRCSEHRLPGWRRWHVFETHGPLWNYNCRRGMMESILLLTQKSDIRPTWGKEVEAEESPEFLINEESDGIKDVEVVDESTEDESTEDSDDDSVFEETTTPVPGWRKKLKSDDGNSKEKEVEKEKEKEKEEEKENSYERDNKTTKLLKLARDKIKDSERMMTVADEKIKALKKELNKKDETIAKERAAVRYWKDLSNEKHNECEQLLDQLERLQSKLERTQAERDNISAEYDHGIKHLMRLARSDDGKQDSSKKRNKTN